MDSVSPLSGSPASEKLVFAALLKPHRSLSPRGFGILMGVVTIICLINAVFYYYLGAWPVAVFMLFDVLLIYLAFQLNYRAGRVREEVRVSREALQVRKTASNGRQQHFIFNPLWAKFQVDRDEEIGVTAMRLSGDGRSTLLGSFLNPDDRESFALAFSQALARVKR